MIKPIDMRESDFKREVFTHSSYGVKTLEAFFNYWSEPNKGNSKMRFEMEKTWHTGRRLGTWLKNESVFNKDFVPSKQPRVPVKIEGKFGDIDAFIERYKSHPTGIEFKEFGKFYDQMKAENLLCQMDKAYANNLMEIYNGDKEKCRCACVMKTMDLYVASGMRVSEIMELRKRLA